MCKSKGGLTNHTRKHSETIVEEANSESDFPKLTKVCSIGVEATSQMIKEIKKKLRDSHLYGKGTVDEVDKLQPSNSFFTYVGNLSKSFSKNLSQDKLLEKFYGNMYNNWKLYFSTAKDGKYVFLVLNISLKSLFEITRKGILMVNQRFVVTLIS